MTVISPRTDPEAPGPGYIRFHGGGRVTNVTFDGWDEFDLEIALYGCERHYDEASWPSAECSFDIHNCHIVRVPDEWNP